jgi:hypothetical protein
MYRSFEPGHGRGYYPSEVVPRGAYEAVAWTILANRQLYSSEAVSAAGWAREGLSEVQPDQRREEVERQEQLAQGSLVHCLLGNPFRPASLPPGWITPPMQGIATTAYTERHLPSGHLDNARLAVLSDALEEVGCTDDAILSHLRSSGPHVRGCFALDLVLGKS